MSIDLCGRTKTCAVNGRGKAIVGQDYILTAVKHFTTGQYIPGGTYNFTITVTNNGKFPINSIVLTDQGTLDYDTISTLAPGQSVVVPGHTKLPSSGSPFAVNGSFTESGTVKSEHTPKLTVQDTIFKPINILSASKEVISSTATSVKYSVLLTNNQNFPITVNPTDVKDILTISGIPYTSPSITNLSATIQQGDSVNFFVEFTGLTGLTNGKEVSNVLTVTPKVSGAEYNAITTKINSIIGTSGIVGSKALTSTLRVIQPFKYIPGETVHYIVTVTNNGTDSIKVTNIIDNNGAPVSVNHTLTSGESLEQPFEQILPSNIGNSYTIKATVESDAIGSLHPNDTIYKPQNVLFVDKQLVEDVDNESTTIRYIATLYNRVNFPLTVVLSDMLTLSPSGVSGNISIDPATLIVNPNDTAHATITFTNVDLSDTTLLKNVLTAKSSNNGLGFSDAHSYLKSKVLPVYRMIASKQFTTGSYTSEGIYNFVITLTNIGSGDITGIVINDPSSTLEPHNNFLNEGEFMTVKGTVQLPPIVPNAFTNAAVITSNEYPDIPVSATIRKQDVNDNIVSIDIFRKSICVDPTAGDKSLEYQFVISNNTTNDIVINSLTYIIGGQASQPITSFPTPILANSTSSFVKTLKYTGTLNVGTLEVEGTLTYNTGFIVKATCVTPIEACLDLKPLLISKTARPFAVGATSIIYDIIITNILSESVTITSAMDTLTIGVTTVAKDITSSIIDANGGSSVINGNTSITFALTLDSFPAIKSTDTIRNNIELKYNCS